MNGWQHIDTAPRNGTPILLDYEVEANDVHGYAPWKSCPVVIGWWGGSEWEICFMYDGTADTEGRSHQFFASIPDGKVSRWMPLPVRG